MELEKSIVRLAGRRGLSIKYLIAWKPPDGDHEGRLLVTLETGVTMELSPPDAAKLERRLEQLDPDPVPGRGAWVDVTDRSEAADDHPGPGAASGA